MFYGRVDFDPDILVETTFLIERSTGAMKNTSSVFVILCPPRPIPNHVFSGKQALNSIMGGSTVKLALISS